MIAGGHELLFFFAGQAGHGGVGAQSVNQDLVGDNVQFFLGFVLYIAAACLAQHAGERALAHLAADGLAGLDDGGNHAA